METRWIEALFAPAEIAVESPWAGLIPVMNLIVDLCRPDRFVELGTDRGCSFLAALSAANSCGHTMEATAIESWQGDEPSGFSDGDGCMREVEAGIARIGMPARLLRKTSDEAVSDFEDGQIDLLHIDGLHTHEASKSDFEAWKPKLSPRAVVLFHDIEVRSDEFGVWRTWEALSADYPHISFGHSHGLGVLFVGNDIPPAAKTLLDRWSSDPEFSATLRTMAHIAGEAYGGGLGIPQHERPRTVYHPAVIEARCSGAINAHKQASDAERAGYERRLREIRQRLAELQAAHQRLRSSRVWPLVRLMRPLRKRFKRTEELAQAAGEVAAALAITNVLTTTAAHSRRRLIEPSAL